MADLLVDADGNPLVFDPRDILEGGNMVHWDNIRGGMFPWDDNYFVSNRVVVGNPLDLDRVFLNFSCGLITKYLLLNSIPAESCKWPSC